MKALPGSTRRYPGRGPGLRHRAGQSQVPGTGAVMRAAGCYRGGRGLLHRAALRAGTPFVTDTKQMVEDPLLKVEELLDVRAGAAPVLGGSDRGATPCRDYVHPREPSTSSARRMAPWNPPASRR